jgi:hypothetical protein
MRRSVQDICEITSRMAGIAGANLLPAAPSPSSYWTAKERLTAAA